VVKFLGGDVRIELSDYGDIRGLIVDGKPGFSPRGVSIIIGKSGSGKTLLANALYMEPVLTIADIVRKLELGLNEKYTDAIEPVKAMADLYGVQELQ
jgi:ABC-type dipeptide/oligopeptide/nickel transport system ATPase component